MKKGYKAFDKDKKCRNVKFVQGKTYTTKGSPVLCQTGFHYCENVFDVYNYYPKDENTLVAEIEDLGESVKDGDKSCTNKIKIVKFLTEKELLKLWINKTNSGNRNSGNRNSGNRNSGNRNSGNRNSGNENSGNENSGNRNSGDWNSGNRNSGDWNSGDGNSGNRNSGDWNSGNRNSGDWNSGNENSGYGNSGNRNSGDWNSGDGNSGYFNTEVPVYFFNKPTSKKYTKELENQIRSINVKPILEWIGTSLMTETEKNNNPTHVTTGGFLRKTERFDWRLLTQKDKEFIKSLPNFDNDIFMQISNGVSLLDDVEVIVAGVTKRISKEDAKKLGLI